MRARLAIVVALAQLLLRPAVAGADPTSASSPATAPAPAPAPAPTPVPAATPAPDDRLVEAFRFPGAPSRAQFLSAARRLTRDATFSLDMCHSTGRGRVECTDVECPGGCQVDLITTRFALDRRHVRMISRQTRHVGDTGQCGCCLMVQ